MKGRLCIGLLTFCIISVLSLKVYSSDTSAMTVSSGIYSTAIYTKNFESTDTRTSLGPVSTPFLSVPEIYNPTGFWDYTQALSFPNPYSNHVGTGFDSSLYFTITAGDVNFPLRNENLSKLFAEMKLGFENLQNTAPYCTSTWKINNYTANSIQFLLQSSCPVGSFPANTSFDEVEAFINFKPESMFWCADDNPSKQCPNVISVAISNIDYYFGIITEATSTDTTIINQNQTIINQNEQLYNFLSDNSPPDVDTSVLGDSAGWLPAGPVDSILTLPITLAQGIVDVFTGTHTCSPIVLPFKLGPYDESLTIPCMDEYFRLSEISILWNAVGTIISGVIIYNTLKWLYKFVDDTLTLRENNSGLWGGL